MEEAGTRKPYVFLCKVATGNNEKYLVYATDAAAVVPDAISSSYVFCNNSYSCVRSSMCFLKFWLQIALESLHNCCISCYGEGAGTQNLVFRV